MITPHRYFILNKPYNMVSQFVSSHAVNLLGDIGFDFPQGIHAVGRLDNWSEGLLILTTNKKITSLLFEGDRPHSRTYEVLVNNVVSEESMQQLRDGISFKIKGAEDYTSLPCEADIISNPQVSYPPPYEYTDRIPYTWIRITLTEGKYHQVRKMMAAIHHRCKRLIRVSIEDLALGDLQPGSVREIPEQDFFEQLKLSNK